MHLHLAYFPRWWWDVRLTSVESSCCSSPATHSSSSGSAGPSGPQTETVHRGFSNTHTHTSTLPHGNSTMCNLCVSDSEAVKQMHSGAPLQELVFSKQVLPNRYFPPQCSLVSQLFHFIISMNAPVSVLDWHQDAFLVLLSLGNKLYYTAKT